MRRWLAWFRKKRSGKSLLLYKGVCYKCFDTRRAHFKAYSHKEPKDARKGNEALGDEFWSRRALKHSKKDGTYLKHEPVDTERLNTKAIL